MATYYPNCVFNLRLRFDEAIQVIIPSTTPAPETPEDRALDPVTPSVPSALPLLLEGTQDKLSWIMGRVPKSASIDLPSYRQAGKFSATFEYRDLPFDPRILRAVGVEVHMGAIDAAQFGRGMLRVNADGTRSSILQTRDAAGLPKEETLMLVGTIDEATVEHTDTGSEVTIEGRDVRGILLDAPIDPKLFDAIDLTQNIVDVVVAIVHTHPLAEKIRVVTNLSDWDGGIIPSPAGAVASVRKGADGKKRASLVPRGDKGNLNFWDVITDVCYRVGAIPFFLGEKLFVRPARALYELQKKAGRDPTVKTPFLDGKLRFLDGQSFGIRKMIFGRGVKSLKFTRKLGGVKVRMVEVSSYDSSSTEKGAGKLLTVRWPDAPTSGGLGSADKAKTTSVAPSGKASSEEVLRLPPLHGITDEAQLREIARSVYEEVGRQELGGSCETRDLASFGGNNQDPDLLRLRPGDAIEFLYDSRSLSSRSPLAHSLINDTRRSEAELIAEWTNRLGDPNLARVLVLTSRGSVVGLSNFFRVANVRFTWSAASGVEISFDFQNYVEARSEVGGAPSGGAPSTFEKVT